MDHKPTNCRIAKVIEKFNRQGKRTPNTMLRSLNGKLNEDEKFVSEYNSEIDYLLKYEYIQELEKDNYILRNEGEIFRNKRNNKRTKIEMIIMDYPYLLGSLLLGIIGGIIGSLIIKLF